MDYKKLYLTEKINAIQIELNALSLKFEILQARLPIAQAEWTEYEKSCEKKADKCKNNLTD